MDDSLMSVIFVISMFAIFIFVTRFLLKRCGKHRATDVPKKDSKITPEQLEEFYQKNKEELKDQCGFSHVQYVSNPGSPTIISATPYPGDHLDEFLKLKQVATLIKIRKWLAFIGSVIIVGLVSSAAYVIYIASQSSSYR